jgi:ABC-type sugar transport system permease subunit
MLPAAAFLILFLAYPLGLGMWLSFTDARIGRVGQFVGLENYEWLWEDSTFWVSVLPGDPAERKFTVQGDVTGDRAHSVHRSDRALGDRFLVALRYAILDHILVVAAAGPDLIQYRLPRRCLERALVSDLR